MGEGHLEQVLDNLIANALDALSAGGHVTVTATTTAAGARITVADDGPGMNAEDRERAFLRFTTSNPNGTGLGLAIVHRLVTSNGGTARLVETPGGGLTAILDFPGVPGAEQHGRGVPFVRAGPRQPVARRPCTKAPKTRRGNPGSLSARPGLPSCSGSDSATSRPDSRVSPSQRETTRHSLRVNLGRMRGQAPRRAGPVEVSVKHSAWATAALAVSATVVIAACGSSNSSAPSAGATSSSASAGSGSSAATTGKFLGCMVSDTGGVDDRSFNAASWAGMQAAAAANSNITVKFSQSTSPSDYTPIINTFLSQKCNIIVTLGFAMGDATKAAATANPSQKFAIVDDAYKPTLPNVDALVFNTVQDGFLGGYLAAGMTKTGKVATFGGQEFPTVTIYMDGYWDGVQYYNPKHGTHVQVLGWDEKTQKGSFTGDFTNQTKGQTLTQTFISEGADIIFPVAGNVGLGAAKAVQQADAAAGSQKVNMEWVDLDGCVERGAVLQVLHLQRGEGRDAGGEGRGAGRGQRLVQGRQLHRHAGQRRRVAGSVPRLRQQGARLAEVGAPADQHGHPERLDPDTDQEPGYPGKSTCGSGAARRRAAATTALADPRALEGRRGT